MNYEMNIDVNFTCRTCLHKTENVVSIYDIVQEEMSFDEMINICTGLENVNLDGFPTVICHDCVNELPSVCKFVKMCKSSYESLQEYLKEKLKLAEDLELNGVKLEIKEEYNPPSVKSIMSFDDIENYKFRTKSTKVNKKINQTEFKQVNNIYVDSEKKVRKKVSKDRKISSKKGIFKCISCSHIAQSESQLKKHIKLNHPEFFEQFMYQCNHCKKNFKRKSDMIVHLRTHSGEKPFACEHCPQRFAQSGTLIEHNRCHTGETPFSCRICSRVFSSRSSFWRHRLVHSGEKPFSCEICGQTFAHHATLKHHRLVHSEERPHSCGFCGKTTKSKYALQQHMITHSEKHFVCEQCGKTFSMKYNLENHIKKMHSKNAGQCNICKKVTSNLPEHIAVHSGETPYLCNVCNRRFSQKSSLTHHVMSMHIDVDKYKCQVEGCLKAFPKRNMLDFHTKKIHLNETSHICQHCSKGFYRISDLSRHINSIHPETN